MKDFAPITERMKARNAIATEYVKSQGIEVNDLWGLVADHPEYYAGGDGTHPVEVGSMLGPASGQSRGGGFAEDEVEGLKRRYLLKYRFLCPFRGIRTGFSFCQNVNVRGARFRYSSPLPKISGNMRFSCREAETYCQRYADLTCHEVCRKIGLTVCGRLKCKYMSMFSRQSDILFLSGNVPNREKTSREDTFVSRFQAVFQPMYRGCRNDVRRKKKCFFSQAIFRSAEIGTRLDLKTVEKQAEIPKICI